MTPRCPPPPRRRALWWRAAGPARPRPGFPPRRAELGGGGNYPRAGGGRAGREAATSPGRPREARCWPGSPRLQSRTRWGTHYLRYKGGGRLVNVFTGLSKYAEGPLKAGPGTCGPRRFSLVRGPFGSAQAAGLPVRVYASSVPSAAPAAAERERAFVWRRGEPLRAGGAGGSRGPEPCGAEREGGHRYIGGGPGPGPVPDEKAALALTGVAQGLERRPVG